MYTTMEYRKTVQDVAEQSMKVAVEEVTGCEVKVLPSSLFMFECALLLSGSSLMPAMTLRQMLSTLLYHVCQAGEDTVMILVQYACVHVV